MYMMYLLKIDTVVSAINVNTKDWGVLNCFVSCLVLGFALVFPAKLVGGTKREFEKDIFHSEI